MYLGHCIASKLARKFTCIFLWPYWTWRKHMALLTVKRGGSNSEKEIAQRVDEKSSVEEREPDGYWAKTWTLSWGVATLPTAIQSCSMPTSSSSSSSSSSWSSPTTNNSEIIKISHGHRHWKCGWTHSNNLTRRWQPGLEARSIINWQPVNIMTWPSKEYRTWSPCLTFLSSIHFDAEQREVLFRPDDWKRIIAKCNVFTEYQMHLFCVWYLFCIIFSPPIVQICLLLYWSLSLHWNKEKLNPKADQDTKASSIAMDSSSQ